MRTRFLITVALALAVGISGTAFAQSTVGTLTGIVTDSSKAVLPGVTVKVTNEDTGVSNSTLTNDTGAYSFLLAPGSNYRLTVEFPGFKKAEFKGVLLRMADTQRMDVSLDVGEIGQTVVVEVNKDQMMRELNSNIGMLLDEEQIKGLPLVGNDPLALITTLPGYRANPLGHEFDTIGGLPMTMINTVRDGLSVTDELFPGGVGSNTILNPDMISEIRLILAPVDAEAGRGNGQVQITTKSGTNKFQWSLSPNIRQNALNALGPSASRTKQPFGATFQYIASAGGPIIKNRTFFFVNFDHQLRFQRSGSGTGSDGYGGYLATPVLTDLARNGIYRYFDGWGTTPIGNATTPLRGGTPNGTTAQWQVDPNDPTLVPLYWAAGGTGPNGQLPTNMPYTGTMKCVSVFGTIKFDGTAFDPTKDCGTYIPRMDDGRGLGLDSWVADYAHPQYGVGVVPGGLDYFARQAAGTNPIFSWEAMSTLLDGTQVQVQRPPDRTGYIARMLAFMPLPNSVQTANANNQLAGGAGAGGSDGLNRATFSWVRGKTGLDNRNTFRGGTFGYGTSLDQAMVSHKVINIKIDHQIGNNTHLSFGTSFQDDRNSRTAFQSRWPEGIDGYSARVPRILTINATTTISNTMVNEARFGVNYNRSTALPPWQNPDEAEAKLARSFLQQGWTDPNCARQTTKEPSAWCDVYGGTTPIYYLPGSTAAQMNFADNMLPYGQSSVSGFLVGGSNLGFGGSSTSLSNCGANSSGTVGVSQLGVTYNCETLGKLLNFADTFSWNFGNHSVRTGGEFRLTRTREDSSAILAQAAGGASTGSGSPLATVGAVANLPGFVANTNGGFIARSAQGSSELLYFLSGSVSNVTQSFWANSMQNFRDSTWETWSTGDGRKTRHSFQNEFAVFFKDDWKIGKRLTLNLGVRYESYGNLYQQGFNTGTLDEGFGLFGPERMRGPDPWQYWLTPGGMYYTGYGSAPPGINVAGSFLPSGQPNYIPGLCNPVTEPITCGVAAGNLLPGGPAVQSLPATIGANSTISVLVNCVYGVQQATLGAVPLPTSNCDPSLLTTQVFVGPGSDHPELPPAYRDRNNIGPAIGFSYRAPFVGGRTLLVRGGFQFTFGSAGRDRTVGTGQLAQLTQLTGSTFAGGLDQISTSCATVSACGYDPTAPSYALTQGSTYALTLYDLPYLTPLQTVTTPPSIGGQLQSSTLCAAVFAPGTPTAGCPAGAVRGENNLFIQRFGVNRSKAVTAFIPGYQDARTENYTFSVSTNPTRTSTLAISYVGTLGRNRPTGVNVNMPNVYYNPELLDALTRTRRGEDVPLFDQMFGGLNLTSTSANTNAVAAASGWGPVGTCVTLPGTANAAALAGLAGKQAAFDAGVRDAGNCGRDQIYQSGSAHLRNASQTLYPNLALNLANGNFFAASGILVNANPPASVAGGQQKAQQVVWQNQLYGGLVRNGCDRIAVATPTNPTELIRGAAATGNGGLVRCFPEDWIIANPALDTGFDTAGGATSLGSVLKTNWGYTNYHQAQIQYTLRLPGGLNLQATYLTSKTLALPRDFYKTNTFAASTGGLASAGTSLGQAISGFNDPKSEETRRQDYGESSDSLKHALRLNGVLPLPFGPGQPLLKSSTGLLARLVGGWQLGVIYNGQSGQPFSVVAGDMLYGLSGVDGNASGCNAFSGTLGVSGANCASGLGFPDVVSPIWSDVSGKAKKNGPGGATTYFGYPAPFEYIRDPQCDNAVGRSAMTDASSAFGLSGTSQCSLRALVLKVAPGTPGAFFSPEVDGGATPVLIMLQNPTPGNRGSLGAQTMRQPSRFYLDANLVKNFMISERKGFQIRVDATNVLNHPTAPDQYFSLIGANTFAEQNQSDSQATAYSSGCVQGNPFCGRQVQVSFRIIQ